MYTLVQTVSTVPHLRLAFEYALPMCAFYVCLVSKVIPGYALFCSSVPSNIIFMGFDLVYNVKCVVKYLVLCIFTHHSCVKLDRMLVTSWIWAVVAYSSVLHRTKLSA